MNRSFSVALFLLAILSAPFSSTVLAQGVDPQPFVPPPGESIKSIAVLKIPEPQFGYFLGEGGSGPGATLVGLRGLLQGWTRPHHPEYAGFQFTAVAERLLTEHLKAAGFNVITVPVERKKRNQLLRNYEALSVPNVDAYLDVATLGVGYRQNLNPYSTDEKVGPYLCVVVRLVSARSKNILYADTIQYGWRQAKIKIDGTDIDAPEQHVFENKEAAGAALTEGAQGRGIAWLSQGMDVAMRTMVGAFSSYPATGRPLQAGSTASPMETTKAAPAAVPSPSTTIPKETTSKRYKIGIFPASGCFISDGSYGCGPIGEKETAQALARRINGDPALVLAYSHYDKTLNEPSIGAAERFWTGNGNRKKPNLKAVYALADERHWDGIFMYWGDGDFVGGSTPATEVRVEFYMINVTQRKVYTYRGMTNTVDEVATKALSTFLAANKNAQRGMHSQSR
jgi:hypothetical protein